MTMSEIESESATLASPARRVAGEEPQLFAEELRAAFRSLRD
jgi:hypothetical protein